MILPGRRIGASRRTWSRASAPAPASAMRRTSASADGQAAIRPIMSPGRPGAAWWSGTIRSPVTAPSCGPAPASKVASFMASPSAHRRRRRRAPLDAQQVLYGGDIGAVGGGEQVAVGPVLQRVAPRIAPVVEHLAAEEVAADAPFGVATGVGQALVTAHQVVEVRDLVGGVVEARPLTSLHQEQRVVIGGRLAAVAAQERAQRELR